MSIHPAMPTLAFCSGRKNEDPKLTRGEVTGALYTSGPEVSHSDKCNARECERVCRVCARPCVQCEQCHATMVATACWCVLYGVWGEVVQGVHPGGTMEGPAVEGQQLTSWAPWALSAPRTHGLDLDHSTLNDYGGQWKLKMLPTKNALKNL